MGTEMATAPVTVSLAAAEFGVTAACVRGWLRAGAPCVEPGSAGRGHGAIVRVAALAAWRARRLGLVESTEACLMERIAGAFLDVLRRDGGQDMPLHRSLGIPAPKAAALLLAAYQRAHRAVTGCDAERLPPEIETIVSVCVGSAPRPFPSDKT
jgi:hypothetical protein